jgi:hypothetical protein
MWLLPASLPPLAYINPFKPNDPYMSLTTPLTSKVSFYIFIQPI